MFIDFPAFDRFFFDASLGVEETRNHRMEVAEQDGKTAQYCIQPAEFGVQCRNMGMSSNNADKQKNLEKLGWITSE
jgi:hypothetical protein